MTSQNQVAIAQVECGGDLNEGVAKAAAIQSLLRLLLSKVDKQKGDPDCFVQIQGWR